MDHENLMKLFIALLFFAWIFAILFQVYARYFGRSAAAAAGVGMWAAADSCSRGLDPSAVSALPTFVYESKSEGPPLECAVCLSEFEDGETGRVMPDCEHRFHVECIDMWLRFHCDCPLCRTRVGAPAAPDPVDPVDNSRDGFVSVSLSGPGTVWRSGIYTFFLSH